MIEAELPDGTILEFPEGTDPDVIQATVKRQLGVEQASSNLTQEQRLDQVPEISQVGVSGLVGASPRSAAITPALLTALDPQEMANILTSNFPDVGVAQTPEGRFIAVNNKTGATAELNKPGLSMTDVFQGLGLATAFIPAGAGVSGIGRAALARAGAQAAGTQAVIEGVQDLSGGEFDPQDIALAGATAPAGQVVGEKFFSPLARAVGGKVDEGVKSLLQRAKESNIDILTTDVIPPDTFVARSLQQLGEKLGVLGTGGKRAAQQRARIDVVEGLASELGVTLDAPVQRDIFKSLNQGVARQLARGASLRREAIDTLDDFGFVDIGNSAKKITGQITKEKALRGSADQGIIDRLETLGQDIDGADFSVLVNLRSRLIDDITAAYKGEVLPTKAVAPLQAVKSAIDADLLKFARNNDRAAAAKWLRSNKVFSDGYRKAKDTEVKRLLNKGEGTPEIVSQILRGNKTSELKRLDSLLDQKGRDAAKLSIIRDSLEESGFFSSGANPNRFATALSKPSRQRAVNVFFKGNDKEEIDGLRRMLEATRRAQEAPVSTQTGQIAAPLAAIGGATIDPGTSFAIAGTLAGATRAYEGAGVRNLLVRLSNAPKGGAAEQKILLKLMPFFNAATQAARAQIAEEI